MKKRGLRLWQFIMLLITAGGITGYHVFSILFFE